MGSTKGHGPADIGPITTCTPTFEIVSAGLGTDEDRYHCEEAVL